MPSVVGFSQAVFPACLFAWAATAWALLLWLIGLGSLPNRSLEVVQDQSAAIALPEKLSEAEL